MKIDLFMPPKSQYGVLHHFTLKFYEALKRNGVNCRLLEAERTNPKPFLEKLFQDRPDFTLSFNGLLPDKEGRFFCDLIKIPHIACLVDSPNQFFPLAKNMNTIITCPDRFSCDFFKGLNSQNVFFMPHAVEKELRPNLTQGKIYDVVMLSSCLDYEAIRHSWAKLFSKAICDILENAAEITLSDQETSYIEAFVQAINNSLKKPDGIKNPQSIDHFYLLDQLETYIRGKDRVELLKGIKDAKVDIFGSAIQSATWKKYLSKQHKNFVFHDPVPYQEAIKIMQKTKILLNSCAWIKNGAHERIFSGIASGALVITNENIFMRENFKKDQNIVFYQHGKWNEVNEKVNKYLTDETKRKKIVDQGRKAVAKNHTWDKRAESLIKFLSKDLLDTNSQ